MQIRLQTQPLHELNSMGHGKGIAFSPDATTIAVAESNDVKVWRVKDGVLLKTIPGNGYIKHITYSPDGTLLFISSYSCTRIWDTKTYQLAQELDTFGGNRGAFSFDSQYLLVCPQTGGWIQIKNTKSWDCEMKNDDFDNCVVIDIVPQPSKTAFIIVTSKNLLGIQAPSWALKPINLDFRISIQAFSISPTANFIAIAEWKTNIIHIFSKDSREAKRQLIGHDDSVYSMQWLEDENILISNSTKGDAIFLESFRRHYYCKIGKLKQWHLE